MIDGAINDGSASLRLYERPGYRYFFRDSAGKIRFKQKGVWISYRQKVYNVSDKKEEYRSVVNVGKYRNKVNVRVAEIFMPEETISFHSLSGNYIVEGLTIQSVIGHGDPVEITLNLEDLIADEPGVIKTLKCWNAYTKCAEEFQVSGKFIKPKEKTNG